MSLVLERAIKTAQEEWDWKLANDVLYQLCKKYPEHNESQAIIAKVWLIGRAYAAAIERRKPTENEPPDYYVRKVVPRIRKSKIDQWLASLRGNRRITEDCFDDVVDVHSKVTNLFSRISGLQKRSLASKYLHFHAPNLFFLYDSEARNGFTLLKGDLPSAPKNEGYGDYEYRKFADKCLRLQRYIRAKYKLQLTPRQIDRVLLALAKRRRKS